ncbi:hypothetical protein [Arthrobacter sp. MYb227]|uniref:hypothetical protein n=1 Tax=Arthrobacter sp. MYb227 TaxID=1848601 RepID=UPI0011B00298|nr:hypothetical protein [Arthrobacter sp. MYb227]
MAEAEGGDADDVDWGASVPVCFVAVVGSMGSDTTAEPEGAGEFSFEFFGVSDTVVGVTLGLDAAFGLEIAFERDAGSREARLKITATAISTTTSPAATKSHNLRCTFPPNVDRLPDLQRQLSPPYDRWV